MTPRKFTKAFWRSVRTGAVLRLETERERCVAMMSALRNGFQVRSWKVDMDGFRVKLISKT